MSVSPNAATAPICRPEPNGLRQDMPDLPLHARGHYDDQRNTLFLNFEGLEVKSSATIEAIRELVHRICDPLGHKVHAVVNYQGFVIDGDLEEPYAQMVHDLVERFYLGVTRFTSGAFIRTKVHSGSEVSGLVGELRALRDDASAPTETNRKQGDTT